MGIDPISLIVAALAAGAPAAAKDTASQAVKDAYNGLKALIHTRFAGPPEASLALTQHELAPQVWQAPLRASLDKTGAATHPTSLEAASRLDPDIAALVAAKLGEAGAAVSTAVQEAVDQVVASTG